MKKLKWMPVWAMVAAMGIAACNNDNEGPDVDNVAEDGVFLVGDATPWAAADKAGQLKNAKQEQSEGGTVAQGEELPTTFEIYAPLKAGTFHLVKVAGSTTTTIGGTLAFTYPGGTNDQPSVAIPYYAAANDATISVAEAGFYHVVYNSDLSRIVVAKATWGLRGDLNSWGFTELTGAATADGYTFTGTNIEINAGKFKFAYSGGWKLGIDDTVAAATVKVNTNFGGALTFDEKGDGTFTLEAGGGDYEVTTDNRAKFTVSLVWTTADGFTSATLTKTGESDAPVYPETMNVVGDGCNAGWTTENGIEMHPTPTAGQFWAIVYLEATGGVKLFPNKDSWDNGKGAPAGAAAGLNDYQAGGENIPVPGTAGYYMLVLDLAKDSVSVAEANVYGMGDAFGGWDMGVAANKFAVNNTTKELSATASAAGNLRSYAAHKWISDWWHAEINIADGKVVYRGTGGDPAAFPLTAGQTVKYNIDAGTAAAQ
jgi:hypothetical protein